MQFVYFASLYSGQAPDLISDFQTVEKQSFWWFLFNVTELLPLLVDFVRGLFLLVFAFLKKNFQQFYISDMKSCIICSTCHILISLINSAENKSHVLHLGSRIICSHFSLLKPHPQAHLSLRSSSHTLNCITPFSFSKEHFHHHIPAETKTPFTSTYSKSAQHLPLHKTK